MSTNTPDGLSVISTYDGLCLRTSWYPVSGATGYNLYRSEIVYGDFSLLASSIPGITYYDTPPTPNDNFENIWYYRVSAIGSGGESLLSGPCTYLDYAALDNKPIPGTSWSSLF